MLSSNETVYSERSVFESKLILPEALCTVLVTDTEELCRVKTNTEVNH